MKADHVPIPGPSLAAQMGTPPTLTDPTPAALYARVSSDRQDVDLSISAQLRALRDYAAKNGYIVAREYVDEAESGRIADRPEFRKMIDEASKPNAPFGEILVLKFVRTRSRLHTLRLSALPFFRSLLVLQRRFKEGCAGRHEVRRGAWHGSAWPVRYYPASLPATAATQPARTVPWAAIPAPPR